MYRHVSSFLPRQYWESMNIDYVNKLFLGVILQAPPKLSIPLYFLLTSVIRTPLGLRNQAHFFIISLLRLLETSRVALRHTTTSAFPTYWLTSSTFLFMNSSRFFSAFVMIFFSCRDVNSYKRRYLFRVWINTVCFLVRPYRWNNQHLLPRHFLCPADVKACNQ